jgi:hypothetical protein
MAEPKFSVGQKVIRIVDNKSSVVLEVIAEEGVEYSYLISYDEGATEGNDGTGYWTENSLESVV